LQKNDELCDYLYFLRQASNQQDLSVEASSVLDSIEYVQECLYNSASLWARPLLKRYAEELITAKFNEADALKWE